MPNFDKIDSIKKSKPFRVSDIFVFVLSGILIVVMFLSLTAFSPVGKQVKVFINGSLYGTYELTEKKQEIELLDGKVVVTIEDGVAWISHAVCPDHYCMAMGKTSTVGKDIICLPNRIRLTISGKSDIDIIQSVGHLLDLDGHGLGGHNHG